MKLPNEKKPTFFAFPRSAKIKLEALRDPEAGKLAKAIFRYAFEGKLPENLDLPESVFFDELREEIDAETGRRERLSALRSELGRRGAEARDAGRKRAQEILESAERKRAEITEKRRKQRAERTPKEKALAREKEKERSRRRRANFTPEQRERERLRSQRRRDELKAKQKARK